ncbi:hypothetical protein P3T76_001723 [Phytophthora citrophthora]|uniref:Uncharacterized protein n=1 Tax=Phytophthora citrophthora TaxID=4793 RepID=A0AAD9GX54_9STRA|nr:hypothetical protein P3T76_001723 [Phytophthora citrophthora]
MERLKTEFQSSAHSERGYGTRTPVFQPCSAVKKPRTTYEAIAVPLPSTRQPSSSQLRAAQTAPRYFATQGTRATSLGAGDSHRDAARGELAPHGSGVLRCSQARLEEASLDYSFEPSPTLGTPRPSTGPLDQLVTQQQEEILLRRAHVLALEVALGLGYGGQAACAAGQPGVARQLEDLRLGMQDLHGHVDRSASLQALDFIRQEVYDLQATRSYRESQLYAYSPSSYDSRLEAYSLGSLGYPYRSYLPPGYGFASGNHSTPYSLGRSAPDHSSEEVRSSPRDTPLEEPHDLEGSNEAMLQLVAHRGANSVNPIAANFNLS